MSPMAKISNGVKCLDDGKGCLCGSAPVLCTLICDAGTRWGNTVRVKVSGVNLKTSPPPAPAWSDRWPFEINAEFTLTKLEDNPCIWSYYRVEQDASNEGDLGLYYELYLEIGMFLVQFNQIRARLTLNAYSNAGLGGQVSLANAEARRGVEFPAGQENDCQQLVGVASGESSSSNGNSFGGGQLLNGGTTGADGIELEILEVSSGD